MGRLTCCGHYGKPDKASGVLRRVPLARRLGEGATVIYPSHVERHRDPVVRELRRKCELIVANRLHLRDPIVERRGLGSTVLPGFAEFLIRPAPQYRMEIVKDDQRPPRADGKPRRTRQPLEELIDTEDYGWRRVEGARNLTHVLITIAACTSWSTMEILDPRGGYLPVVRLAELAELSLDKTERALRHLREAGIVCFTQQRRELLASGKWTSTGPALRKLAVGFFRKMGGYLLVLFNGRRKKAERAAEKAERRAPPGDMRHRAKIRELARKASSRPPAPANDTTPEGGGLDAEDADTRARWIDQVAADRPEQTELGELVLEARRRFAIWQRERGPPPF